MKPGWEVQGNYGYGDGFECVTTEETRKEALVRLREYQGNEPGVAFRIRREKPDPDLVITSVIIGGQQFSVKIHTSNAAFADGNRDHEVDRILNKLRETVLTTPRAYGDETFTLFDFNGNSVGYARRIET